MTAAASARLRSAAREIFAYALKASSIPAALDRHLRFEDAELVVAGSSGQGPERRIALDGFRNLFLVALGKAAVPMLDTLMDRLPAQLAIQGVCSAPAIPREIPRSIRYFAGGHPLPNRDSFRSARAALRLLKKARRDSAGRSDTFVFFLVSGGGSAMFELPLDKRISLEETEDFYQALVGSGATIAEINAVRKHFSAVKGGRLAAAAHAAEALTLLVSDVPEAHLDALASGPTLPDRSTVSECREILSRYGLPGKFPPRVEAFFEHPDLEETPGDKRGGPVGADGFVTLLSERDLLHAARSQAEAMGFFVVEDSSCDDWDYREAARHLMERLSALRREHPRVCLLSGGEVTVRLEQAGGGPPGIGGRNQQFALACALALEDSGADPGAALAILSAGSDGIDGNSPAAGAVVDRDTAARARALGIDPAESLATFHAFPLFAALGDAIMTGPSGNNLRDLRILLSVRE